MNIWNLMDVTLLLKGLGFGAGLIVAIGSQNAFVLRQGLKREHVFWVALVSALADVLLILLGTLGLGTLFSSSPLLIQVATWGGALFLFWYGFRSFRAVFKPQSLELKGERSPSSLHSVIGATLAFSLLNPHVYLDTVVLIGSVAARESLEGRTLFGLGASIASIVWFFGLAYGAGRLTPLFQNPRAWQILDALVGLTMWGIALSLLVK
jgi:L-lysine exporter family protein LysE/ArgO